MKHMIKLTIDDKKIEVPSGTTLLEAARQAGIAIPSMCYLKEFKPSTSCMVCMVKIKGRETLIPSCGARAEDGMDVESNTPEVLNARKNALELLLSEHAGDCLAPCQRACPFHIDIPLMIRHIQQGDGKSALDIIARSAAPSPAMCAACKKPCESACRRRSCDEPVAISLLMQSVLSHAGARLPNMKQEKDTKQGSRSCSVMRKISEEEFLVFLKHAAKEKQVIPAHTAAGYNADEAGRESRRCFHCDCRKKDACALRQNADAFGAKQAAYSGQRTAYTQQVCEAYVFEPGKCIKCGICVSICKNNGVAAGFTFFNRGFDTTIGVPFDRFEDTALQKVINQCIEKCPTGALACKA